MIHNLTNDAARSQMMAVAERIFGTAHDPDQIPVTMESRDKLKELSPDSILYETDDDGKLRAWVVVVPTTKHIMEKFLKREITERELFEQTQPAKEYDAVYLCAAVTLPEHRRKGYATMLMQESLRRLPLTKDFEIFAWPTTEDGKATMMHAQKKFKQAILMRQSE